MMMGRQVSHHHYRKKGADLTMMMNLRKLCLCLIFATLCLTARADDIGGIKEEIAEAVEDAYGDAKNAYDKLPESGKFAVGAGAGFIGSRVAVSSAVTGVKVAGAAFVVYVVAVVAS
jgi:hypothetical protein